MSRPDLSELGGRDVLQRAAAALRAAHDGQREGSGFTRARILATVSGRRRTGLRRWLLLAPLASALLVGSAWAQSTGSWPRVWQAVARALPFIEPRAREPLPGRHAAPAVPPPPVLPRQEPPPEVPAAPEQPAAAPPHEQPAPATAAGPAPVPAPAATEPVPSSATPQPLSRPRRASSRDPAPGAAEPAADAELSRFRAAHELHVQGQPRAARAAYEEYLQAYPRGRFVPEARYNSALDAIKLGDYDGARRWLRPFADGAHGEYRRAEARRLLDALDGKPAR